MGIGSYKIAEGLEDKIDETTRLKFRRKGTAKNSLEPKDFIKVPIPNKKILVSMAADEFCDTINYNYNQKSKRVLDEFNLHLKSRYELLLKRKWVSDSKRKVKF